MVHKNVENDPHNREGLPEVEKVNENSIARNTLEFIQKIIVLSFCLSYITVSFWLFFDGLLTEFSSLKILWNVESGFTFPIYFQLSIFSIIGAILGCGVLDIISFHKYVAIYKKFDSHHMWGYFFSPFVSAILGIIVFALLKSGLLIFAGGISVDKISETSKFGFLAIGFITGFGWYQFTKKLQGLVTKAFEVKKTEKWQSISKDMAPVVENKDATILAKQIEANKDNSVDLRS